MQSFHHVRSCVPSVYGKLDPVIHLTQTESIYVHESSCVVARPIGFDARSELITAISKLGSSSRCVVDVVPWLVHDSPL